MFFEFALSVHAGPFIPCVFTFLADRNWVLAQKPETSFLRREQWPGPENTVYFLFDHIYGPL